MSITFPTTLDTLTNPTVSDYTDTSGVELDLEISNLNDAVEALEAKVGVDSSAVGSSIDYKLSHLMREAVFTFDNDLLVQSGHFRIPNRLGKTCTITGVYLLVDTAPTGQAVIVDVNKNGTTIFTTQANRPQVAISANEGSSTSVDVTSWADGEYLTVDIDQVGSVIAGSFLVVVIAYY